jgi:hypothetical protein
MQVWVISLGDYEDHGCLAIVQSEEKAREICDKHNVELSEYHPNRLYIESHIIGDLSGLDRVLNK